MAVTRPATRNGAKQHSAAKAAPLIPIAMRIRPSHDGRRVFASGSMAPIIRLQSGVHSRVKKDELPLRANGARNALKLYLVLLSRL
jgi:hypothetical protein